MFLSALAYLGTLQGKDIRQLNSAALGYSLPSSGLSWASPQRRCTHWSPNSGGLDDGFHRGLVPLLAPVSLASESHLGFRIPIASNEPVDAPVGIFFESTSQIQEGDVNRTWEMLMA